MSLRQINYTSPKKQVLNRQDACSTIIMGDVYCRDCHYIVGRRHCRVPTPAVSLRQSNINSDATGFNITFN